MIVYIMYEDKTLTKIEGVRRIALDHTFPVNKMYAEYDYCERGYGELIDLKKVISIDFEDYPVEMYERILREERGRENEN